ncbi:MAG: AAA family ATPase [Robiginitalea sp.]
MAKRILITGGPGTGKSVLVRELENHGYQCFHEIIREMTKSVREEEGTENSLTNPLAFVSDPWTFNKTLLLSGPFCILRPRNAGRAGLYGLFWTNLWW